MTVKLFIGGIYTRCRNQSIALKLVEEGRRKWIYLDYKK